MNARAIVVFCLLITGISGVASSSAAAELRSIDTEHFRFRVAGDISVHLADSVLGAVRLRMMGLLNDSLQFRPEVFIVDDTEQFNRLVRGRFPDWGGAAALPELNIMVLKSPWKFNLQKPFEEFLAHEYVHLALHHRVGGRAMPRWFDEGLAMYVSSEWGWSDNVAMGRAAVFGKLLRLEAIERLNRFTEGQARVAYAQSYLTVKYLFDDYGRAAVNRLIDSIKAGVEISPALEGVIGSNISQFEAELKEHINRHFNIKSLFMDTMLFWLAMAAIVLIAGVLRFRKRRQYYKRWEDDEKLHSTDFDYGDPDRPEHIEDDEDSWRS